MRESVRSASWLAAFIIILGLLYFGYKHLLRQVENSRNNPFEYNIDEYKTVDPDLLKYRELPASKLKGDDINAITVTDSNSVLIATGRKLQFFDREMKPGGVIKTDEPALAVETAGDTIYAAMKDHISVYRMKDGSLESEWSSLGEKARLTSIAIIKDNLFVSDSGNRRIWHFNLSGKLLGSIGDSEGVSEFILPSPYFDVAAGIDDTLWAVNPGKQTLINYTLDRKVIKHWGKASMQIDGFSGCCNPSHIAVLPDGSIVTGEKGLPRVKIMSSKGKLISVAAAPDQFADMLHGKSGPALLADLAVDREGTIYVLDRKAGALRRFVKNVEEK